MTKEPDGPDHEMLVREVSFLIARITGIEMSGRNRLMVETRLRSRMTALGLRESLDYLRYIRAHPDAEVPALVSALTTHHTSFFREFAQFEYLENGGLEQLVAAVRRDGRNSIKVWSAACSHGQEVYSLAAFLAVHLPVHAPELTFEVLGTDIDTECIAHATNGVYRLSELAKVPPKYIAGQFIPGHGEIAEFVKVSRALRERCSFQANNLIANNWFAHDVQFDLVFCRNVFLYFAPKQVAAITRRILAHLRPEGILCVGVSESLNQLELPLRSVGPSIYAPQAPGATPPPKVAAPPPRRLKVLIVDPSFTTRMVLKRIFATDTGIEVVAEAERSADVEALLVKHRPNVMLINVDMPEVDGLELVRKMTPLHHVPAIMITSFGLAQGSKVLDAMELGAVDYVQKPSDDSFAAIGPAIIEKVRIAARVLMRSSKASTQGIRLLERQFDPRAVIAIGASTGGPEALRRILSMLPRKSAPILIVQHIPPIFSAALATRLNGLCELAVSEAVDGEEILPGRVLIAPGGKHLRLKALGGKYFASVEADGAMNGFRPAVDALFNSVADLVGRKGVGVLLTGMGNDGASGLLKMRQAGASTMVQDEATSVVFGMPREAIKLGAASEVRALDQIPLQIIRMLARAV